MTNSVFQYNRDIHTDLYERYHTSILSIDLNALEHNYRLIKETLAVRADVMAIVKANAYGHGMIESVNCALRAGIAQFGVANVNEAFYLRSHCPKGAIVVLDANFPEEAEAILMHDLHPFVYSHEMLARINAVAELLGRRASVHIKVDSGMGRIGVHYDHAAEFIIQCLRYFPNIIVKGICTHFAAAESDKAFSQKQWERFYKVIKDLESQGIILENYHIANTSASFVLGLPYFNLVRLGILTYGIRPRQTVRIDLPVKPVMRWSTRVIHTKIVEKGLPIGYGGTYITPKKTCIITIPVGYADGYPRSLSNKGIVVVGNKRCPIAGRVAMDHCMVDIGLDIPVAVGDEVVLIGSQSDASITVEELANLTETIPYEITCNAGKRARRIFLQ